MRACSVDTFAARSWSSQKPGSPISRSSSACRAASASGSKVITDPGELGPDLLELLLQRDDRLGHGPILATGPAQAPLDGADPGQPLRRLAAAAAEPDRTRESAHRLLI